MTAVVILQEKIAEDIYSMWLKAEPVAAEVSGDNISHDTNDGANCFQDRSVWCEIDKEKGALVRGVPRQERKDRNKAVFTDEAGRFTEVMTAWKRF